jgi:hypothetical protein
VGNAGKYTPNLKICLQNQVVFVDRYDMLLWKPRGQLILSRENYFQAKQTYLLQIQFFRKCLWNASSMLAFSDGIENIIVNKAP